METAVQFSWSRLEGLGLIVAALGWGFFAQVPPTYFALTLLYLKIETYFVAVGGTILASSIILATISCSLAEDWDDTTIPSLKRVSTFSFILIITFLIGFFLFFFFEPFFPPEYRDLVPTQRYFSAITIALALVGVNSFILYRIKNFLNR